jgi:hypothetical protein
MSLQNQLASAAQSSETVATIINTAATAEAMAVTLLGAAIRGAAQYANPDGSRGLAAPLVTVLKAAQAAEQAHYAYLTGAGATAATLTFHLPDPKIATETRTLFQTIESLESAFIAAYLAAAREFAEMKQAALVKVALQIGGTEAEHRALARLAQGDPLPHNLAFEPVLFAQVGDAAAALEKLGFIGGTGPVLSYADFAGAVDNQGVSNLTPGGAAASPSRATAAPVPAQLPQTGGWPVVPILAAGAGLALLGGGVRRATGHPRGSSGDRDG